MSNPGNLKDLPYRRSFAVLGKESQAVITSALLRGLGFEVSLPSEIEGLSGIRHFIPLIGVDSERKRFIVVQTGADQIARFYHEPRPRSPNYSGLQEPPKSPTELRFEWLQKSLFTTFDIKAAIESQGLSCSIIYFFNSFEVPTVEMTEEEVNIWWRENKIPGATRITSLGASEPIGDLDISVIREHVISAGAAFIDANQLQPYEIGTLAGPWGESVEELVLAVLARTRLRQFFAPPLDELLLGTLGKAESLTIGELERVSEIAQKQGHQVAPNTIVKSARHTDPIETLRELRGDKYISLRRREVFVDDNGRMITQEWEKTAEEPLFIKVLRELRLPELIESIIRAFR
jgi:hypothetical protein